MNDIPVGKADGLDGIQTCLLKLSFTLIASSLTRIFNLVISTGIIPKDWKSARVTPIFKADSKVDPANYRPISVLPVIAKLIEKAIFNQVYTYLNDNKLLSKYQSGFRLMHSTLTALIDITDNWYLNIDNGLTNAILFIDLKRYLILWTMRSFCQNWSCMGLKVQVLIFFETTSLTELRLQLSTTQILKLVSYVVGRLKAQSSAPCYSYCTLTTSQTVTSCQM